jgi:Protein of unknown function (DUF998)
MSTTLERPSAQTRTDNPAKDLESCGEVMSRWWKGRAARKALLFAGIVAVALYVVGDLVSGLLYGGYSFRDQAVSELAAFGSPVRPLMVTIIMLHNVLVAAFGIGVFLCAARNSLRWVGISLVAISVTGIPTHTVFAMSSRWMETGFNDTMHQTFTAVFSLLVVAAIVLSAIANRGWFRTFSITMLVTLTGFGMASVFAIQGIEKNATPWAGAFELINVYAYFAWIVVLAVILLRSLRSETSTLPSRVPNSQRKPELTPSPERDSGERRLGLNRRGGDGAES